VSGAGAVGCVWVCVCVGVDVVGVDVVGVDVVGAGCAAGWADVCVPVAGAASVDVPSAARTSGVPQANASAHARTPVTRVRPLKLTRSVLGIVFGVPAAPRVGSEGSSTYAPFLKIGRKIRVKPIGLTGAGVERCSPEATLAPWEVPPAMV
jgi:hypothetical protein